MRLLDRYLLREFLVPFLYCLGGFFIFWVTFDLLTQLDMFQRNRMSGGDVLEYYLIKTPDLLSVVLPVALLLGLLYSLANHARYNELTAMRAAGLSLWRLSLPYFAVGFVLAVALFGLNELWMPDSVAAAERVLMRRQTGPTGTDASWERNLGFSNTAKNRKWFIERYDLKTFEMIRPRIEWTLVTGTRREISAE